ncbi:hypothetical protein KVV02_001485 [Mortierella alpina]|uniref:Pyrimidine 5-nucleotidase n=1 Tax=Mortierella alpina TaxID=64518 RepID=A0A9P8CZE3_MORAP|nr:hypothetical protein KVV02_001485 [Mortierella alpina]
MPSAILKGTNMNKCSDTMADGPSSLDISVPSGQEAIGNSINRSITPNHEPRCFFFDIDNCLYPKDSGIPDLMREKIEQYFKDVGFDGGEANRCLSVLLLLPIALVQTLSYRYYIDYGLAIRGLVLHHPGKNALPNSAHNGSCHHTATHMFLFFVCRSCYQIDIKDYDDKVDGSLPLEEILQENIPLREMIKSMNIEKKWLFTNAGKNHALRVIKVLGLEGLFDGLTYCDYQEPNFICKPEAESFHKAMTDAGVVHPSNCYFVDDSAANVDKAMDIGWTAVHVADDPIVSNFGHFQISNILELPNVLPEFWESPKESSPKASEDA